VGRGRPGRSPEAAAGRTKRACGKGVGTPARQRHIFRNARRWRGRAGAGDRPDGHRAVQAAPRPRARGADLPPDLPSGPLPAGERLLVFSPASRLAGANVLGMIGVGVALVVIALLTATPAEGEPPPSAILPAVLSLLWPVVGAAAFGVPLWRLRRRRQGPRFAVCTVAVYLGGPSAAGPPRRYPVGADMPVGIRLSVFGGTVRFPAPAPGEGAPRPASAASAGATAAILLRPLSGVPALYRALRQVQAGPDGDLPDPGPQDGDDGWKGWLSPGERLLWQGAPARWRGEPPRQGRRWAQALILLPMAAAAFPSPVEVGGEGVFLERLGWLGVQAVAVSGVVAGLGWALTPWYLSAVADTQVRYAVSDRAAYVARRHLWRDLVCVPRRPGQME